MAAVFDSIASGLWNDPDTWNALMGIASVNQGTKTFTFTGQTADAAIYDQATTVVVTGSTGNNGTYTVVSATFDTDHVDVVVVEAIPSAVADGSIQAQVYPVADDSVFINDAVVTLNIDLSGGDGLDSLTVGLNSANDSNNDSTLQFSGVGVLKIASDAAMVVSAGTDVDIDLIGLNATTWDGARNISWHVLNEQGRVNLIDCQVEDVANDTAAYATFVADADSTANTFSLSSTTGGIWTGGTIGNVSSVSGIATLDLVDCTITGTVTLEDVGALVFDGVTFGDASDVSITSCPTDISGTTSEASGFIVASGSAVVSDASRFVALNIQSSTWTADATDWFGAITADASTMQGIWHVHGNLDCQVSATVGTSNGDKFYLYGASNAIQSGGGMLDGDFYLFAPLTIQFTYSGSPLFHLMTPNALLQDSDALVSVNYAGPSGLVNIVGIGV